MKNIDLKRSFKPVYSSTWNLNILTNWLDNIQTNSEIFIDLLKIKCILLFKILTITRFLNVEYISYKSIIFMNEKKLKNLNHQNVINEVQI